jgi:hypothetical protein
MPANLREAPKVKYPSGFMFRGAISTKGLIPHDGPLGFTELYARFLREEVIPAINEVFQNVDEVIFQDDQDSKQRTQTAMDVIYDSFEDRVEPNDGDAKFADV